MDNNNIDCVDYLEIGEAILRSWREMYEEFCREKGIEPEDYYFSPIVDAK